MRFTTKRRLGAIANVRVLLPDKRAFTEGDPWGAIVSAVEAEAPDVIGLTAVTATYPAAAYLASLIKERLQDPCWSCYCLPGHAGKNP